MNPCILETVIGHKNILNDDSKISKNVLDSVRQLSKGVYLVR